MARSDIPEPPDRAAIQFMILDFLEEILKFSEHPGDMGRFLAQHMREFLGVRTVALLQHGPDLRGALPRIVALEPERARDALDLPVLTRLIDLHPDLDEAEMFVRDTAPREVAALLDRLQVASLSLTPLRIGGLRVGTLFALDHLDFHRTDDVLRLLTLLSPVFALIKRSAVHHQSQEAKVLAQAREYEALLRTNLDGFVLTNGDGWILDANGAYLRMSGYTLEEIRTLHISALDALETPEETDRHSRGIQREGSDRFVSAHRRKDGTTYPVEVSTTYVPDQNLMIGFIRDLTAQVAAERALRESEARHRELVEILGEGVFLTAPDGSILMANPAAEHIFGVEGGRLLGENLHAFLEPSERTALEARTLRRREGHTDAFQIRIRRPDGTPRILQVTASPQLTPDGAFRGTLSVFRDVTEELKTQEALRLAQKMDSLGNLAGGLAHDMNNVLGAILGLASMQLSLQPEGSSLHATFQTITKACERGRNMVNGLLNFARKDVAGKRPVQIGDLIRDEVRLLERTIPANIRIDLDLDPLACPILGDPDTLSLVLMNLCVNAIDAMPEGGRLTLTTRALPPDGVYLSIADTGTGMPPEVLERALEPFFTTKPQGKGTGLGLSQVYSAVKAHHGKLEIRSRPGEGTTLEMRFPAAAPVPAPAPARTPEPDSAPGALTVLLVDDDELIQEAMAAQLELLGHQAALATSGEEALERVERGLRPAVVILDMNMPGLGGARTLPRLRAALPEVPIFLSTGRTDQQALDLAESNAGVTILPKPFGLPELRAAFSRIPAPG